MPAKSPSKSCELDPVPTFLIKDWCDVLIPLITRIVNKSLNTGVFPTYLKTSYIRPLLKKSGLDKEVFSNYRPISNLSFLGKTIERIVSSRLQVFMRVNNLTDSFQSAYRPNHSTETALIRVHNDILTGLDQQKVTALIFLDLSAAFDTVDHSILLSRLRDVIGLRDRALQWCQSYLECRPQYVRVGDAASEPVQLEFSVPQGSVLGPQLFSLYTFPLQGIIRRHNLQYHTYADDTQIFASFNPSQQHARSCITRIEACVSEIRQWMNANFLKINDNPTS